MKRHDPIPFVLSPRALHAAPPPISDDDLDDGLDEVNLRLLDAVYYNAGLVAAEDLSPPTADELADEAALKSHMARLRAFE